MRENNRGSSQKMSPRASNTKMFQPFMCRICRNKDKVVVNFADLKHSDDLSETQQMFSKNTPTVTMISELVLYRILAKCSLPKCEPFATWVFDDVLHPWKHIIFLLRKHSMKTQSSLKRLI